MKTATLPHHAFGAKPGLHRTWLVDFVNERGAENVAEIGVLSGKLTRRLLTETRAKVWAVDHWKGVPGDPVQARIYRNPAKSERVFRKKARKYVQAGRLEIIKADSMEAAVQIFERWGRCIDIAFLDADHSYDGVRGDIWAWCQVVRIGGILSGHDLNWPGVRQAVSEAYPRFHEGDGNTWWVELDR